MTTNHQIAEPSVKYLPKAAIRSTAKQSSIAKLKNVGGISASASTEPLQIVKPSLVDALSLIHPTDVSVLEAP